MSESTALLVDFAPTKRAHKGFFTPYRRMLCVAFFLSVSFATTAAPIFYAYRTFNCEEYYRHHPPYEGEGGDECAIPTIEKNTARSLSLMTTLTAFSALLNLMTTRVLMRKYGIRAALVTQTVWPLLRNICQMVAMHKGGNFGINVFQVTQLITILGGGSGYLLSANSFVAAVVDPEDRTASFGQLSGVCMLGTAFAFTLGGAANTIHPIAPFAITWVLLLISCFLSRFAIPYLPPAQTEGTDVLTENKPTSVVNKISTGFLGFFSPLKAFKPRRINSQPGRRYWGVTCLALGSFTASLASTYVPLMLQLTSTNKYGFKPAQNGYLMSTFALSRASFLTFVFPQIIKYGRIWHRGHRLTGQDVNPVTTRAVPGAGGTMSSVAASKAKDYGSVTRVTSPSPASSTRVSDSTVEPSNIADIGKAIVGEDALKHAPHERAFDLIFLRWSIFVDACLTSTLVWHSAGWQMYLAGLVLPLASGTAPAAKGVVMEMVHPDQKTDALSAIALIDVSAMVTTASVFGTVFAILSEYGLARYVFAINAAVALVATMILSFATLPPRSEAEENDVDDGCPS